MIQILEEAAFGSIGTIFTIATIVIPLMIFIEIFKRSSFWGKFCNSVSKIIKYLGFSKNSAIPLAAGIIFGLIYGAGTMFDEVKKGLISPKEIVLINIFLVLSHAMIEDTAIFVAIGANFEIIFFGRLIITILFVLLFGKILDIFRLFT
ncbi:Nucleoside recognition [Thermodesulfobium acidiphilum]|uniref:Nucleoside recognition n=1 Tax=Thermodesulfobium acidiphilum TaxID=1794699 RepID=A0A2R4W253_THEAF|nr:nucleoside recognition domain-containing protein [Thermodesulfobium acidiphilum]AWB10873.1 Nucleoside recognition [Thermodesulfobium acidiphilum]PMP85319.1 MAG: nucleoside recognition protein [Thermodesulfobium narugense]